MTEQNEPSTPPNSHRAPEEEILLAANERFLDYMRERHYPNEEAVLADVQGYTTSGALIRAVAKWRISKRVYP